MNRESILNAFQEDPHWRWYLSEEGKNMSGREEIMTPVEIHVSIKNILSKKDKAVSEKFFKLGAKIEDKLKTVLLKSYFHKIFPEKDDVIRIDPDLIFRIVKIEPEIQYNDKTGSIMYDLRFTFQVEVDPYEIERDLK